MRVEILAKINQLYLSLLCAHIEFVMKLSTNPGLAPLGEKGPSGNTYSGTQRVISYP
jgi:hypothetical protein